MSAITIIKGILRAHEHATDDHERAHHVAELRAALIEHSADLADAWGVTRESVTGAVDSTEDGELARLTTNTIRDRSKMARERRADWKAEEAGEVASAIADSARVAADGWDLDVATLARLASLVGAKAIAIHAGNGQEYPAFYVPAAPIRELAAVAKRARWTLRAHVTTDARRVLCLTWRKADGSTGRLRLRSACEARGSDLGAAVCLPFESTSNDCAAE
jgi:hypothetical protein